MKARKIYLLAICTILLSSAFGQSNEENADFKVLCITPNNLGANFNFNMDNMEAYGWDVSWAGLTETVITCSWSRPFGHLSIESDTLIQEIMDISYWDAVAIMPAKWWSGTAYGDLINSQETLDLLVQARDSNIIIWATCAGVRVLAAADIIDGINVTGKSEFASEYIAAGANYLGADIPAVIDGNFITSTKGMYYHYQNIEAIITAYAELNKNSPPPSSSSSYLANNELDSKDLIWSKSFGGQSSEGAKSIVQAHDGGLIICGYESREGQHTDLIVIKTDSEGNELWNYRYEGSGWETGYSICELLSGEIIATGFTTSSGAGLLDVLVVKLSQSGDEVWTNTYGGTGLDIGTSVFETTDENLLICGYTESLGAGEDDIYVLKLDKDGNEIWSNTYGGEASDMGRDILELSDGNYGILGNTGSEGAGNRDIYLIKTDTDGNILWTNTYGTNGYQDAFSFEETSDNGFIIAGHSDIHNTDLLEAYVIKTNSYGFVSWENMYEGSDNFYDYAKDVVETQDGNFLICGHTKIRDTKKNQAFIFLINPDGNEIWMEEYGGEGSDWSNSICKTNDGNYAIAGHTESVGAGRYDIWLFKLQNSATSIQDNSFSDCSSLQQNAPNPMRNSTRIIVDIEEMKEGELSIIDSSGSTIKMYTGLKSGHHVIQWDRTDSNGRQVEAGVYFMRLQIAKKSAVRKIIVID